MLKKGQLGKAIDLSRLEGRPIKNRVRRVGIELEGAWRKLPAETRLEHDGSVVFAPGTIERGAILGELPSPPLEMNEWEAWLRKFHPDFVNETCGMHVHMSFANALTYQRIMDPRFPATVIAYVGEWAKAKRLDNNHCIWSRLRGDSQYCQHKFFADDQVSHTRKDHDRARTGNRYTVINYAYSRYGTAECRLLPMMRTADESIDAIRNLISITNKYLVATSTREKPVTVSASDEVGDIVEELNIRV